MLQKIQPILFTLSVLYVIGKITEYSYLIKKHDAKHRIELQSLNSVNLFNFIFNLLIKKGTLPLLKQTRIDLFVNR